VTETVELTDPPGEASPPGRRSRRWRRAVVGLVALAVIVVAAGVVYVWNLERSIRHTHVEHLSDTSLHGAEAGTENVLIVGSTDRCGLKIQSPVFGSCADGVNGINSDVIMILHLDPHKKTLSLLSIPRDTFIPDARSTGPNKVDAGLYQGPSQLVDAIQTDFGIPIRHYVELNFDGFQGVVNALGGVRMYFPEPVYDANSGLDIRTPGCQHLSGYVALEVVRARHLQYKPPSVRTSNPLTWPQDPESDLSRIRRDHEFLRVLAEAVAKQGLTNPLTDQQLISALLPQMRVDQTFSLSDMVDMVTTYHKVKPTSVAQFTLPVSVDPSLSYLYDGVNYGNVAFPSQPQDREIIQQFLGLDSRTDTRTGTRLPASSKVTVTVMNGTGENRQAANISNGLTALGFQVTRTGDANRQNPVAETVVYYATPADQAGAQAVLGALNGPAILARTPKGATLGPGITVVTGSQLAITTPATTATSQATSTTTTLGTASTTLQPPNPAVTGLAPFDPRSCTPAGGEGP
jgi:polyisoprenyl-teichoic acid--peptidoglycan teichoic acid transferase